MRISDWSSDVCSSDLRLLESAEIVIRAALLELAAQNLLPVRTPLDLRHALASDDRDRARRRRGLGFGRVVEVGVLEVERLVVVVDFRQVGIGEDVGEEPPLAAHARLDAVLSLPPPADRKSVVEGKSVSVRLDPGGCRLIKKK